MNLKTLLNKLMGIYEKPELERILNNNYELQLTMPSKFQIYRKDDIFIVYDYNNDKIIRQYKKCN